MKPVDFLFSHLCDKVIFHKSFMKSKSHTMHYIEISTNSNSWNKLSLQYSRKKSDYFAKEIYPTSNRNMELNTIAWNKMALSSKKQKFIREDVL
jgi:macrodomain Ter protein organizer (MatP/YcbG family)